MKQPKVIAVLAALGAVGAPATAVPGESAAGDPIANGPPAIKPANFVRKVDNPYFPLEPGTTFVYTGVKDGKRARNVLRVTHRTENIKGVKATVIHDRLYLDGKLVEDTIDWYAQDKRGDVVYLGESTRALGPGGRLTDTEGSWKTGVDGAQAGIFMPAHPKVGQTFRQEFYKGHAEDHFKILSKKARVRVPAASSKRALKTREWTPLEPTVVSNKLYVKGIGAVREVDTKGSDEHLELVSVHKGR
jgi:hypothetical protein